jgi:exosortase
MTDAAASTPTRAGVPADAPATANPNPVLLPDTVGQLWQSLPQRGLFVTLLAAWAILFQFLGNSTFGYVDTPSLFGWLHYAYQNREDDQMGYLMPLVVVVLFWVRRADWLPKVGGMAGGPLAWLGAGAVVHAIGFVTQQARISVLGFLLGLYAILGVVWGARLMRAVAFPFFLLMFCVPLGNAAEMITFPLRMLVTRLSVGIAHHGLGFDVMREGSLIFAADRRFQYDVAPACSGIRSLVALAALTTVFAFLNFRSWWRRGLVLLLAAPLAVAGNTLRILCVIIAGEAFGQEAGAAVESWLGFVTFALAIAVLFLVSHWLREDRRPNPGEVA